MAEPRKRSTAKPRTTKPRAAKAKVETAAAAEEPEAAETEEPVDTGGGTESPSAIEQISAYLQPSRENVMLIYVLYLVGAIPAFGVVPIVIGFVMALLNREASDPVERSHYEYQYGQFLKGLLFTVVSAVLVVVLIGIAGLIVTAIWWLVRSVKGLLLASRGEAIPDPRTWTW